MIKPIIASILDNDLYKFTQQWAVLKQYPTVEVEYAFNNRRKSNKFNQEAVDIIKKQVEAMERKMHEFDVLNKKNDKNKIQAQLENLRNRVKQLSEKLTSTPQNDLT